VIPTQVESQRATSIEDAITQVVAGGRQLLAAVTYSSRDEASAREPTVLIDIAQVQTSGIRRSRRTKTRLAPATVPSRNRHVGLVREEMSGVSGAGRNRDPPIRNRGTIGGSLAHSDLRRRLPRVMLALRGRHSMLKGRTCAPRSSQRILQGFVTVDLAGRRGVVRHPVLRVNAPLRQLHQRASTSPSSAWPRCRRTRRSAFFGAWDCPGGPAHATRKWGGGGGGGEPNVEEALAGQTSPPDHRGPPSRWKEPAFRTHRRPPCQPAITGARLIQVFTKRAQRPR